MTKAFVYGVSIIHMGKVPQQTVIVMTAAAVTIVMWISAAAMVIPQAAKCQNFQRCSNTWCIVIEIQIMFS